jgi:hypothetical protein
MSWFPTVKPCPCGSGEPREEVCDARGIFVAFVCDHCRERRLAGFRPEILTDSNYECDEPVDPDDEVSLGLVDLLIARDVIATHPLGDSLDPRDGDDSDFED